MSNNVCGNQRAARNGEIGEQAAQHLYDVEMGLPGALIDGSVADTAVEIKTCQEWITDASCNRRRGRYLIARQQHEELLQVRGCYAFILLDAAGNVLRSRFMPATSLILPSSIKSEYFQLVWSKVHEMEYEP